MLTAKQKRELKSIAMTRPITEHVGKDGLNKALIEQVNNALIANELVKIKVLPNSMLTSKEVLESLALALNAEQVQAIGRVAVLYKRSTKDKVKHLLEEK